MRRPGVSIIASTIFAGVALGLAAPGGNINLPAQMITSPNRFQPGAATHETRADSQSALWFPNASEVSAGIEAVSSTPSTRSSIMAIWQSVRGAKGYLLDVSTTSLFSSYVEGYHDLDVGNVIGRVVTGLNPGITYYYRVHPYTDTGLGSYSETMTAATVATAGLIIQATFDSSITGNPNAAVIEAMIDQAISIYESLFTDSMTIQIRFRYATTAPNGTPLPAGTTSRSDSVVYTIPWHAFINALTANATTSNDNLANASLPVAALSANIKPSSANGRAVGLDTPPAMFANGTVGNGGPYDGIITLNSAMPFQFTRPPGDSSFDAQRSTEHEIDEVIGLGSRLGGNGNDLRPQDLFSWSSAGVRNITSSGTRYLSIDGGPTNIVNFNQDANGDFGDWFSEDCPQPHPYVQNAFACQGQYSDVAATSPEGINLDVIGYDLVSAPVAAVADFNGDGKPDYVLRNAGTGQTAIWYLNNNFYIGGAYGPTLPVAWSLVGVADFNRDGKPDYVLFNATTLQTAIWYLNNNVYTGGAYGPTLPAGWSLVGVADFNLDGQPDYALFNATTLQTAIWYLNNNVYAGGAYGPTLPTGWSLVGVADFNRDGYPDYALFNLGSLQTEIWYLSGATFLSGAYGPTLPSGWQLVATADFNGDGKPDYVLSNSSTRQTGIWYLDNNVYVGGAYGPTLPAGWRLVAP